MRSRLIRCGVHPGRHIPTVRCAFEVPDRLRDRLLAWLEGRLNPKRGDPNAPRCAACGNWLIETRGACRYCDKEIAQ